MRSLTFASRPASTALGKVCMSSRWTTASTMREWLQRSES
jgi:hypothetical protein